ncbi:MAG: Rho GTPase [Phylliscum demangeonii]|nr:MAG: Rho GTPase [Phylliscum demangeonii]
MSTHPNQPEAADDGEVGEVGGNVEQPQVAQNVMRSPGGHGNPLWDTAGQEDYERLRPLAYSKAHVLLIAFSVETPDSLENVKTKWIDEATERCPSVPIILVGLKKDLRDDPIANEEMRMRSQNFVSDKDANDAAQQIGARKYLECSALTGEGVDDVFEAATRASLLAFEKGGGFGCCVML